VLYGNTVRALRSFTKASLNKEPEWRHARPELTSGYNPDATTPATAERP
jgi:hydrogenase small subunit